MCSTQKYSKLSLGCYELSNEQPTERTYEDFQSLAKAQTIKIFGAIEFEDVERTEDMFWSQMNIESREYAMDNELSLFGDDVAAWNLDKFTKDESSIHTKPSHRFLKVIFKLCFSMSCFHNVLQ